jgi:hypothetical protein
LLCNAFEGARGEVVAGLPRNRNAPRPVGMLELSVASARSHQRPAGLLQVLDHLTNFRVPGLAASQQQPDSRSIDCAPVKPRHACQEALP